MRSGRLTAEQAAADAALRINDEINRTLMENPLLQAEYYKLTEHQKQIDARRAAGRKVPLAWIENPFHRAYYKFKGWAE